MDIPEEWRRKLRRHARIDLTVATHWYPDAGPPSSPRPLDFCLHVGGGSFSYLTRGSPHDGALADSTHDRLLAAAQSALDDRGNTFGVDTAVGRSVTSVTLGLHDVVDYPESLRTASIRLNHLSPHPPVPQPGWASLVQMLASLVAPQLGESDLLRWLFLLDALGPPTPLPAPFFEGKAVLCPVDTLLHVPFRESLFLRVGQPPGQTSLLEVRRAPGGLVIVRRDDGEELLEQVALRDPDSVILRTNEDLVPAGVSTRGGPYRADQVSSGLAALWRPGAVEFRLVIDGKGRVALDVRRPSLGLYVQRR